MENDTIRTSGGKTFVDVWIEGKVRGICVSRGTVEAYLGLSSERGAMSDEERCDFVRTNMALVMKAATQRQRRTPDGNIIAKPGVGTYTYDPDHPHAVASAGAASFEYDEVGNQITRPGATISYTAFDLPKAFTLDQAGPVTLDYDGNQQRIRKTTPTQETVYVGDLYERVSDLATGAVEHRYIVHGPERAVAIVRPGASPPDRALYLHVDHLGSVEAITAKVLAALS